MSDFIPFPNADYPDTSPEANAVGNYYWTIITGTHPAIVASEKAYQDALCGTDYFCCGGCNCYLPPCNEVPTWASGYPQCPDSGCKSWWTPWWDIPPCGVDPIAKAREDTLRPIEEAHKKAVGREARIRLTGDKALLLSNERLSGVFYNSMRSSTESILIGMINTFLQAGAIAGAVAGASQVFSATMGIYESQANRFIQSFQPYNPPPIGGGGMGGGLS